MAGKGLYIQIHSMHGLLRGEDVELGRDEDTGGQILYVLYLAKEMAKLEDVERVELVARLIKDPEYPGYDLPVEKINPKLSIVRFPCGGEKYMKKVLLWPHLDEFIGNVEKYWEEQGRRPDVLHSNYADSGWVCTQLSRKYGIPHVHTGHSLGKAKMKRIGVTEDNYEQMDKIYHFTERVKAEEETYKQASAIVVSTDRERIDHYGMYDVDVNDGRFVVIPPGINSEQFHPYYETEQETENDRKARERLSKVFAESLSDPGKPMVFTISRLDHRKNLPGLVRAYAQDRRLQELSNLVIFAGKVTNVEELSPDERTIWDEMNRIMEEHGLKGKACFPSHVDFETEVGELYRMVARSRGVFVNPAFTEPFGLTIIEAAASGIPVVATDDGGPRSIITEGENGLLVDVNDPANISGAVRKILEDASVWEKFSKKGIRNAVENYTWAGMARKEVKLFNEIITGEFSKKLTGTKN